MQIKLSGNAQNRIYQNILKKAEAASKSRHTLRRMLIPMAACLLLFLGISLWANQTTPQKRPVAVVSPVQQVPGAEALSPAGVFLDAPELFYGASEINVSGENFPRHFFHSNRILYDRQLPEYLL